MSIHPLFVRDDDDSSTPMCSHDSFWEVLVCVGYVGVGVGVGVGLGLALARLIVLGSLVRLYRRAINGCIEGTKGNLPIIIDFYFYFCILHPIRRLRVLCYSYIHPRFRDGAIVKVPRDCILPQELCEVIIRFSSSERGTLLSCSLVCKAWVPTSRCLLCTHVHSHDHVREFVKLLQSRDNTISPHIQTVWLEMHTKRDRLIRYRYALCALANANAMPTRAIIAGQSLDPVTVLHRYFPHIKRLSFNYDVPEDNDVASDASLRRILWYSSLFCDLERLSIRFSHPRGSEDIPLSSLEECKPPTRLRSLSLKCWNRDLLRWLERHGKTLDRLTTFKMKFGGSWGTLDPTPINAIFRVGYTKLQVVALTIVEWDNGFLDLSPLAELRTVILYIYHFPSGMQTISSLNSSHIETVTVITSNDESMMCNSLDAFMSRIGFTFLYGRSALRRYVPSTAQSYSSFLIL
ncbi:hypothetical protein IW261DRAFT_1488375 [Armillaria novae-zelandiae]|uniref:F-box domain-containing protein n=1 Tax=Armillaria novae-zelandiae TaxID=153914 RepID=A0AA39P3T2_9AGAR|nr:hypothetical protein IW261DRAFT_1488375 [Armillaria novae-zelandiae]